MPHFILEKLQRGLESSMVPIVIGAKDVRRVAPPGSYIHVLDYPSPRKLADYINLLDTNDTLYKNYFQWKENYRITGGNMRPFCQICQFLHSNRLKKKMVIERFDDWFFNQSECRGDVFELLPNESAETG